MSDRSSYTREKISCYHCGDLCTQDHVAFDDKDFCCNGCKTVYEIFKENDLCNYYDLEKNPGITLTSRDFGDKFQYLDNHDIQLQILDFIEGTTAKASFYIPSIHCSSCIWLLENLYKLKKGIRYSRVNFTRKEVAIDFNPELISLRELVESLATVGYEPYISLDEETREHFKSANKTLIIKIGVAGFSFGNIMLLSFPEYFGFEGINDSIIQRFISLLNIALALPVVFYCSTDYFKSAWSALKQKYINIDFPISIGILSLFMVSLVQIVIHTGAGYLDSLAGLLFFLLIGRWLQNKTYEGLSFERDYRSYFPLAVTLEKDNQSATVPVRDLQEKDIIQIRNSEIIPADCILLSEEAFIDYSFVTGEAEPVLRKKGDFIYAGGKQSGQAIRLEVQKSVSQSYLTQLWNNEAFQKAETSQLESLINQISKYFTLAVLGIAFLGLLFWMNHDSNKAWFVLTSVLIVACPCALALSTPFTLGNTMNVFGRNHFYIKNPHVIEKMTAVDHIVFDKTGTLTNNTTSNVTFLGDPLNQSEINAARLILANSTHPLSRKLFSYLKTINSEVNNLHPIADFREIKGKGLQGIVGRDNIKIGSGEFIHGEKDNKLDKADNEPDGSCVYIAINDTVKGKFIIQSPYRSGIAELATKLGSSYKISILSGDHEGEKESLKHLFGPKIPMVFNQKPDDKLIYVRELQNKGGRVMMLGDGLNDAGALVRSHVGIAVTEDITSFTPASDAILDGQKLSSLADYIRFSKTARNIIILSFIISFLYNLIGMGFALSGNLTPIIAAILMPASSISVVIFATFAVNIMARIRKLI